MVESLRDYVDALTICDPRQNALISRPQEGLRKCVKYANRVRQRKWCCPIVRNGRPSPIELYVLELAGRHDLGEAVSASVVSLCASIFQGNKTSAALLSPSATTDMKKAELRHGFTVPLDSIRGIFPFTNAVQRSMTT